MTGLLKRICVKRSSQFFVMHFIFCTSCIFRAGCRLFYWLIADHGAVSSRETIGFVWLIFLVAHLCILYWLFALCADFVNGNSWFCLSDILTVILSVLVSVLVLGKCHVKKVAFSRSLLARCNCGQTCWKKAYSRGNGRYCFEITTFWLFIHFKEQYSTLIRCRKPSHSRTKGCLLYTSDAADE